MPRKDEILSELLARKTREIVARSGNYAAFLRTAARNYKYTFREQVLIHAQRPDATACAEIDTWNHLGRRVNRGSHRHCSAARPQLCLTASAMYLTSRIPTTWKIGRYLPLADETGVRK